jgi:tRNA(fMet)-specific endonuclease VapC
LDFDEAAATQLQEIRRLKLGVGTMDLKIASIALSNKATLLTKNIKDFRQIPNLNVEDWTKQGS